MSFVQKAVDAMASSGQVITDVESPLRGVPSLTMNDKTKSDVFSLGLTILHAGVITSIGSIYNHKTFEIDAGALAKFITEFEQRYKAQPLMISTLKRMLQLSEDNRPNFAELKKDVCPDMGIKMKDQSKAK